MSQQKTKMVPLPSEGMIPERDIGSKPILECRRLGIEFGGLKAVDDFNLTVGKTEIAGLIGPNGAGKTTIFNLLTKVYQPTSGTILFDGKETSGMNTMQVNRAGIARTFQNIRLFSRLTVEENVKIGLQHAMPYSTLAGILRLPSYWKNEKRMHERALELLSIFDMQDLAEHVAGSLPYGAQRRLEIVRALATGPKLLLLDEPAAGMNPSETAELMANIRKIRDAFQIAVLLIEHDMKLVMGICEGIAVLNYGRLIAKGTPEEIQNDPVVIEAYLGAANGSDGSARSGRPQEADLGSQRDPNPGAANGSDGSARSGRPQEADLGSQRDPNPGAANRSDGSARSGRPQRDIDLGERKGADA